MKASAVFRAPLALGWCCAFLATTIGCSGPDRSTSTVTAPTASATVTRSIDVSGASPAVGAGAQFVASATMSTGTVLNVSSQATWHSSNAAVVTVSASGFVTATGLGTAELSATYQGVTGAAQVSVTTIAPGRLAFSTTASQGWSSIDVTVGSQVIGTLRRFFEPGGAASCEAAGDARVVTTVSAGSVSYSARSDRGTVWSGSAQVTPNGCFEVQLTCENRNCAPPAPAPAPAPAPTPPPTNPPAVSSGFYVWGGANYSQYLGFFTCINCTEFASDSINNQFGTYGSQFSSTSIRNQFSQYGSQFSTFSACNEFASTPPRVFNSNRSVYYGELTVNQFRSDAIRIASIVSWLTGDVCRH